MRGYGVALGRFFTDEGNERKEEVVTLDARPRDVRLQSLLEAVMLSLIGGSAGVMIGAGGSYLFGEPGSMGTTLAPTLVPMAFASAAAAGIYFGYHPALQAAQLRPIEALRHE